jgi:hypothetical protein
MLNINDKITYTDKNNNRAIGKILRVLRSDNIIIKKVIPDNNSLIKIKKSSIICNNTKDQTVFLTNYKEKRNYKKTDDHTDLYIDTQTIDDQTVDDQTINNSYEPDYKYKDLMNKLEEPNLCLDIMTPIFILIVFLNLIGIAIYISYIKIQYL